MQIKSVKKWVAMATVFCLLALFAAGCGKTDAPGKVYFLNFKPEQKAAWEKLAAAYTEETDVAVTVVTAASDTYEDTLSAEIVKDNPPTLFQVNGPVGLANWKDYCYDLTDTKLYTELTADDFALKDDGRVLAVAYVVETYGIIYNKPLLDKYFAADWASIKRMEDLRSFAALSKVATEIQTHREEMGVKGAFTSAGMTDSSDWRFKTHLANLPLFYEYTARDIDTAEKVEGRYLNHYRQVWDLYLGNATCAPTEIGAKTGDDAASEFANREAVFYQNGTWCIDDVTKNGITAEELGMMPIYIGVEGEENQGLCTGSENYWCVNKEAREQDIAATLQFLEWVITSEKGTTALAEDMGFSVPFRAAKPATNPLVKEAENAVKNGLQPVGWNFATMPSEDWKNGVGAALLVYAQGGQTDALWDKVVAAFVNGWETEYNKNH